MEWRRGQRGGVLERHVGVVLVVASSRYRSIIVAAAADSRAREACVLELAIGVSPGSGGLAGGPPPRGAQRDGRHRGVESPASPSRPSETVGGAASSSPLALRRLRPPRLELLAEASIVGEADRLNVDAEGAVGGEFRCRPAAPLVIAYLGRRSLGCACFPRRWRGPRADPGRGRGLKISPRAAGGAQRRRQGSGSKWGNP
jgi:hypothetical protein